MVQKPRPVGMQTSCESFVKCEEQPWPDCGGPSNTFIPPHAVSGRQNHPNFFLLGFRLQLNSIAYFQKDFFRYQWGVPGQFWGVPGSVRGSQNVGRVKAGSGFRV